MQTSPLPDIFVSCGSSSVAMDSRHTFTWHTRHLPGHTVHCEVIGNSVKFLSKQAKNSQGTQSCKEQAQSFLQTSMRSRGFVTLKQKMWSFDVICHRWQEILNILCLHPMLALSLPQSRIIPTPVADHSLWLFLQVWNASSAVLNRPPDIGPKFPVCASMAATASFVHKHLALWFWFTVLESLIITSR